MEESDKRQLEGLLQARSEDLRHGRQPRTRRPLETPVFERPVPVSSAPEAEPASAPSCEKCGGEIGAHRLRAMPRAALCLDCQRTAEQAGSTK